MDGKLVVTFKPLPHFEPYVAAVLSTRARQSRALTLYQHLSGRRDSNPPSAPIRTLQVRDGGLDVRRVA